LAYCFLAELINFFRIRHAAAPPIRVPAIVNGSGTVRGLGLAALVAWTWLKAGCGFMSDTLDAATAEIEIKANVCSNILDIGS
jgi:hypothetical protein